MNWKINNEKILDKINAFVWKCIQDSTYFLKKSQKKILVRLKFLRLQKKIVLLYFKYQVGLILYQIHKNFRWTELGTIKIEEAGRSEKLLGFC